MNVKKTFINLTKFTYTHGTERLLEHYLPAGFEKDKFDNYFIKIGESETMFTCHLDTATSKFEKVKHVFENNFIKTDGSTILGADDKAGMTIMLSMIDKEVPGLYYFFLGEEVGCIGSGNAAKLDFSSYKRCISFDRRGYGSVITHQLRGRCCSQEFANKLSEKLTDLGLTYQPDSTGIVTDSAMFVEKIPECTNLSVGYFNEHTRKESQDISYLKKLCQICIELDWENLPTVRNPKLYDIRQYGPADEEEYEYDSGIESAKLKVWIDDALYLVKLNQSRIIEERGLIHDWIFRTASYGGFKSINWDGKDCYIEFGSHHDYIGDRDELIQVIDRLNYIPVEDMNILKKIK
jgi:hypothetical protein